MAYLFLVRRMDVSWNEFITILPEVLTCVGIGCAVGVICRTHIVLALLLSIVASAAYGVFGAWRVGTLSNQISLQDPGGTIFWLGIPYVVFYLLPTMIAAMAVSILWRSHAIRLTSR